MRENEMYKPMSNFLDSKGYKVISMKKGREPGPDIVAEHQGHKLIMEIKGDTAALDVDLGTGIYQLLRHMHTCSAEEYALGISEAYIRLLRQIESPLKKLNIKVFVVSDNPHQLW